jgi:hypothetical protein
VAEPRIILFDLEVLADMREVRKVFFGLGNYPGLTLKASINSIICAGWKVYGESKTHCINAWDYPSRWKRNINDDELVTRAIYDVLKDADAVVTHNGKRFDWKFLQTRLMRHGLKPLGKIKHIDTCAVAKRHLFMFNNKLDTLSQFLTTEKKMDSGGAPLWCAVAEREERAQKKMADYCKQDVKALEAVFKKLKPFITDIPNYNLYSVGLENLCPNCGSTRLQSNGTRVTAARTYRRYICLDCSTWSRTDAKDRGPRAL